jgi:hypothetical protein
VAVNSKAVGLSFLMRQIDAWGRTTVLRHRVEINALLCGSFSPACGACGGPGCDRLCQVSGGL